jgi:hypothetical protein
MNSIHCVAGIGRACRVMCDIATPIVIHALAEFPIKTGACRSGACPIFQSSVKITIIIIIPEVARMNGQIRNARVFPYSDSGRKGATCGLLWGLDRPETAGKNGPVCGPQGEHLKWEHAGKACATQLYEETWIDPGVPRRLVGPAKRRGEQGGCKNAFTDSLQSHKLWSLTQSMQRPTRPVGVPSNT